MPRAPLPLSPLAALAPFRDPEIVWRELHPRRDEHTAALLADYRGLAEAHGRGTWAVFSGYAAEMDLLGQLVVFPATHDEETRLATTRELLAWSMLDADGERSAAGHVQLEGTVYGDGFEQCALRIFQDIPCALFLATDDEEPSWDELFDQLSVEAARLPTQQALAAETAGSPLGARLQTPLTPALKKLVRGPATEAMWQLAASGHVIACDVAYDGGELSLTLDTVMAGLCLVSFPDSSPVTGSPAEVLALIDERGIGPATTISVTLRRPSGTPAQEEEAAGIMKLAWAEIVATRPVPKKAATKKKVGGGKATAKASGAPKKATAAKTKPSRTK